MWVLNSMAIGMLAIEHPENGRLIDRDADLRAALSSTRPDLEPLVQHLLSRGVVGVTETTPGNGRADFAHMAENCAPLKLLIMGGADLNNAPTIGRAQVGPLKLHYHDHDLPSLDDLAAEIADAHRAGRNTAMHCVTRAEIMLGLAAFEQAGVLDGDRLEHGAIADFAIVEWIARLGLTVVTQPHFVTERADAYLSEVDPDELPHLWPLKRFADVGVPLAAGSDAPFGGLDPWQALASAGSRPAGLSPEEALTPDAALALYAKPLANAGAAPRKVAIGEVADLCLIDRTWSDAAQDLASIQVRATWIDGELVYDNISSTKPHSNAV
jgi:imidazolonepropionase-like amidohydrolase